MLLGSYILPAVWTCPSCFSPFSYAIWVKQMPTRCLQSGLWLKADTTIAEAVKIGGGVFPYSMVDWSRDFCWILTDDVVMSVWDAIDLLFLIPPALSKNYDENNNEGYNNGRYKDVHKIERRRLSFLTKFLFRKIAISQDIPLATLAAK